MAILIFELTRIRNAKVVGSTPLIEAFNKDIFPYIGQLPVNEIKPLVLLNVLRRMESRGATEKAKKVQPAVPATMPL